MIFGSTVDILARMLQDE
uniref:Uncharacterized protein n=1 Tax=Anguilla anguilla TaxID=7936 RepID=A0A0E9TV46_ANGAN